VWGKFRKCKGQEVRGMKRKRGDWEILTWKIRRVRLKKFLCAVSKTFGVSRVSSPRSTIEPLTIVKN
jgi:hypothetical protein